MSKYLVFLARGNELGYLSSEGFTSDTGKAARFGSEETAAEAYNDLHNNKTFTANIIYELIDNHGFASICQLNDSTK